MQIKTPVYLDYQSTTPTDPAVLESMLPYFSEKFGNPSSSHSFGFEAESVVNESKRKIAELLGADPEGIIFTSGSTESINLIHFGLVKANSSNKRKIITTEIEHSAVLSSLEEISHLGYEIVKLKVDNEGKINLENLEKQIDDNTFFVSIMAANNEIGTTNNVREIGKICKENNVFFHSDATQAVGKIPFNISEINTDAISLSAHKIYGPKGIGLLYFNRQKPGVKISPLFFGGKQQNAIRPGTLNVPSIVGFTKALSLCIEHLHDESNRLTILRNKLLFGILAHLNDVHLNGSLEDRLPNNLNLRFENIKADKLILSLKDIAVSKGSACSSESSKVSHVLKAIGLTDNQARSSIRLSLGRFTTEEEIDYAIGRIVESVNSLKIFSEA